MAYVFQTVKSRCEIGLHHGVSIITIPSDSKLNENNRWKKVNVKNSEQRKKLIS